MSDKCTLNIELDESIKDNSFFQAIESIELEKIDIFKYGILNEPVPDKIKENQFEYLESKIPSLCSLYEDFIEIDSNKIVNTSKEENSKRISEIIGVGVGLLYMVKLLKVNPNVIKRIPPAKEGKYLDFKIPTSSKEYEVETKGTINLSKKKAFLDDIEKKKENSTTAAIKCGVITIVNKEDDTRSSKIIVSDDWNENNSTIELSLIDYFQYYELFLSFILDSTYYNRMHKKVLSKKISKNMIRNKSIPHEYIYEGRRYAGQFFDKRLILDLIRIFFYSEMKVEELYRKMTEKFGKLQIFMGIDRKLLDCLNSCRLDMLQKITGEKKVLIEKERQLILDSDGIIIVISDGSDKQFYDKFTEQEVISRMQYVVNSINNTPHECGAPCRSRQKEGEPCQKITYREHCHFHRD